MQFQRNNLYKCAALESVCGFSRTSRTNLTSDNYFYTLINHKIFPRSIKSSLCPNDCVILLNCFFIENYFVLINARLDGPFRVIDDLLIRNTGAVSRFYNKRVPEICCFVFTYHKAEVSFDRISVRQVEWGHPLRGPQNPRNQEIKSTWHHITTQVNVLMASAGLPSLYERSEKYAVHVSVDQLYSNNQNFCTPKKTAITRENVVKFCRT